MCWSTNLHYVQKTRMHYHDRLGTFDLTKKKNIISMLQDNINILHLPSTIYQCILHGTHVNKVARATFDEFQSHTYIRRMMFDHLQRVSKLQIILLR